MWGGTIHFGTGTTRNDDKITKGFDTRNILLYKIGQRCPKNDLQGAARLTSCIDSLEYDHRLEDLPPLHLLIRQR